MDGEGPRPRSTQSGYSPHVQSGYKGMVQPEGARARGTQPSREGEGPHRSAPDVRGRVGRSPVEGRAKKKAGMGGDAGGSGR
jgi:hypothetical protein